MDSAVIFILILVVAIIVIIVWFAIDLQRRRAAQLSMGSSGGGITQSMAVGTSQPSLGWGQATPVPGDRGMCALYTFPAISSGQPTIPTLNNNFVDQLTPSEIGNVTCTDADQLALQKVNQPCMGNSVVGNVCYGSNGQVYSPGQSRQYYVGCNVSMCNDMLAQVALNFNPQDFTKPPAQYTACLQFDSSSPTDVITGQICNLQNSDQILRVERQTPNGTAADNGQYGRLFDRVSGLCVVPSRVPPSSDTTLQLGPCAPSNGYVWWFFPPTSVANSKTVDGQTIPTRTIAPQQLIYYPNNGSAPPQGVALDDYIEKNSPLSIHAVVNNDGTKSNFGTTVYNQPLLLQPFSRSTRNSPSTGAVGNSANTQTLDYWLYQTITQTPVTCLDCGTNFTF